MNTNKKPSPDRRIAMAERRLHDAQAIGLRVEAYVQSERRGLTRRAQDIESAHFDALEKANEQA